jgi:Bacterial Ig domain
MRSALIRLAALSAGVMIVASCDTRLPTATTIPTSVGSTGSVSSSNTAAPTVVIDSPLVGALINVGDSVLVTVQLHDTKQLTNATISGVTEKGSTDLGTYSQTPRYKTVPIPASGAFRVGLRDTTVRRYLQPINAADTTLDSLRIIVIATDSMGGADTATRRINIVAGPKVSLVAPTTGDSIPAGVGLNVSARAEHPNGVSRIDIRVQGEANWPTKFDTSFSQVYTTNPRDITFSAVARVPLNAPLRGRITITATATDVDRQPGSASPVAVFVRSSGAAIPRVVQTVPPKSEYSDSVVVHATGEAITTVGLIIRDSTNAIIQRDTVQLPPPFNANVQATIALALPPTQQGKKLGITAFAVDQAGRTGYAVPATRGNSESDVNAAQLDSTLIVYGRTYALPQQGTIGDVAVDAARGNVFLSNTAFNLLDVWQSSSATKGFAASSIPVGSLPWGLFISNNPDTLLVANSGGTNISRVYIGSTNASSLREDLANRILTRNTYVFTVTMQRDLTTGKIKLSALGPFSYSDRPQYIAQSHGGRVFYSTRPTATAPAGTIRWLDPKLPVPDPRQIWQYGSFNKASDLTYALFNVDSIALLIASPASDSSDRLVVWDHPYGQSSGSIAVIDSVPVNAVSQAIAGGSDAELVAGLDLTSLALTDTTFTAASGDRNWIAFGEGHKPGAGRVIMVEDAGGAVPNFFSPLVTISDLTDNASEEVFGLAIDANGATVASHGSQSFFSAVSDPFHLRLQGKYDSFDNGAGIAFHPNAAGTLSPANQRLAFVAASSGVIEIVDVAYYINRGKLPLKNSIYGPLRASLPMPGDSPDVVMKLYAVSPQGLVVIDLTADDIKPGPP